MTNKRDSSRTGFAALANLRDQLPAGALPRAPAAPIVKTPARAVVRLERKHRRGKEVTIVDKLELSGADLERWCRELKQTLGCGGTIEDGAIVLQGDFRTRIVDVLAAKGVGRITIAG